MKERGEAITMTAYEDTKRTMLLLKEHLEQSQSREKILLRENTDLHNMIKNLQEMIEEEKKVTIDKWLQTQPKVAKKIVQTVCFTYARVLTQTDVVAEEGREQRSVGTETTADVEMTDASVPKLKPKLLDHPSDKDVKQSNVTGHAVRVYVVHRVACLRPMAVNIREVERALG